MRLVAALPVEGHHTRCRATSDLLALERGVVRDSLDGAVTLAALHSATQPMTTRSRSDPTPTIFRYIFRLPFRQGVDGNTTKCVVMRTEREVLPVWVTPHLPYLHGDESAADGTVPFRALDSLREVGTLQIRGLYWLDVQHVNPLSRRRLMNRSRLLQRSRRRSFMVPPFKVPLH